METKFLLLLGCDNNIREYVKDILNKDVNNIEYYPDERTHYSEFEQVVDVIRNKKTELIVSQNMEFVDVLLKSELNFDVITVIRNEKGEIKHRTISKEKAFQLRDDYCMELRG